MSETDYGELERTLVTHAGFLAKMREALRYEVVGDPLDLIRDVAHLRPESVAEWAEQYDAIANFYINLRTSMKIQLRRHRDAWRGEAATEFRQFYRDLESYISGEERSLSELTRMTAEQMRDTALLLLEWQQAFARIIRKYAEEDDKITNGAIQRIFDAFSNDPAQIAGSLAKSFFWALSNVNNNLEEKAREGGVLAGTKQSYIPLNAQRLHGHTFERRITDVPNRVRSSFAAGGPIDKLLDGGYPG